MYSMNRRVCAAIAVGVLATPIWAGGHGIGGGMPSAGGKIDPAPDPAGHPMCFGDGSGTKCPAMNEGQRGHGCENSARLGGALLWAEGAPTVSHDRMALHADLMPWPTTVVFLQSEGCRNQELGFAFGDGILCTGRSTIKLGAFRSDGYSRFPPLGSSTSVSSAGKIPAYGGERYYQVLYRDRYPLSSPTGFNTSNAWSIEWTP